MGSFKTIGDKEHVEIIGLYAEGLGYNKLAEKLNRSSRTPFNQVKSHNDRVKWSGFCVQCRRFRGKYENEVVKRGKKK